MKVIYENKKLRFSEYSTLQPVFSKEQRFNNQVHFQSYMYSNFFQDTKQNSLGHSSGRCNDRDNYTKSVKILTC